MLPRRLLPLFLVPLALVAVGTVGFRLIEGPPWSLFDALYMTVITVTSVGFLEVHPLSTAGRAFTMVLCATGVFTLFYLASEFIRVVLTGELRRIMGKERMERNLADLRGHVIVCGMGRMGRLVCREFEEQRRPFVVIERDEELLEEFRAAHGLYVHGDATDDEVLRRAGVERAKALVSVVASDSDNLYITLSARLLNEKLVIVARAEDADAVAKLRRVGANHVVSPYITGGFRIAQAVLRPAVTDFLELATRPDYSEMQIEEVRLKAGSPLEGQTLGRLRFHQEMGVIVVAIKRPSGQLVANPSGDTILEADSTLIALGHRDQLDRLEQMAGRAGPNSPG